MKKTGYILIIVFLAGFSFLIFEVSWFRLLSLAVGATVAASTLVLAGFMAGLGTGAYFWGDKGNTHRHPWRLLALLFAGTGTLGFANYFIIKNLIPSLYGSLPEIIIYLIAFCVVFVPAFLMGGLLPLISKLAIHDNASFSSRLGKIYAAETLGSTLGGLAAGFILIGALGQQITLLLASIINLSLAIGLFVIKSEETIDPTESVIKPAMQNRKHKPENKLGPTLPLLGVFTAGIVGTGMQVVWMRFFKIYLTNTSYTFALISSMVVLGLFTGSWWYSRNEKKVKNHSRTMLNMLIMMAIFLFIGLLVLLNLHSILLFPLTGLFPGHVVRIIIIPVIASLLIIIPVSFISGYIFPLACTLYNHDFREISRHVGHVLLANTAGSVAGPLIAAFALIPLLGAALSAGFIIFIVLAVVFMLAKSSLNFKNVKAYKWLSGISAIVILMVIIAGPQVPTLPPSFNKFKREILAYKETVEGTYVVGKELSGKATILSTYVNNSSVIGNTYDAIKVVKMVGHLPFFAGLKCENALVVGFGIGVTTSAIAAHPDVRHIDCIELVAGLKDASKYYGHINNGIEKDPRLTIISGDGRHFLQTTRKKYDLISSDPTHPILGSGSLYTKEYFQLCCDRLTPDGMVSQYLPLHKLTLDNFLGIIKTFYAVFPNATVWIGHYHAVLLGTNGSGKIDFEKWSRNIESIGKDTYFYNNPYHLAACLVLDSAQINNFPLGIRINTDNNPYTEFFKLSSFDEKNLMENLKWLNMNRGGVERVFTNVDDAAQMDRFEQGNYLLTEAVYHYLQGNANKYIEILQQAIKANPEDEEYPFLIKFHYATL